MRFPKSLRNCIYIAIGYALGLVLFEGQAKFFGWVTNRCSNGHLRSDSGLRLEPKSFVDRSSPSVPSSSNIYIGMMSAGKYVESRVQRALDTWLQRGGWKVEVFADASPSVLRIPEGVDINIVTLPSVDDTAYPPQKKCFMLVKHMFDEHINNFEWFLRVDDDAYIDYERLSRLLNTINSSLPIFFGSPGFGMDGDDGMETGMIYLMGGPGMIMSRGLLQQLRPKLSYCLRHMFSPHEDIEIGRCIWKNMKDVIIPVAWEGKELFYQQYDEKNLVANVRMKDLRKIDISKMATYHAIKEDSLLQSLHKHVLEDRIQKILDKSVKCRYDIDAMRAILNIKKTMDLSAKSADSDLPLVLGYVEESDYLDEGKDYLHWPSSMSWQPGFPSLPRFTAKLPWTMWDKYYRQQPDPVVPSRGNSPREQAAMTDYLNKIESKLMKLSCPTFPDKGKRFSHGYLQSAYNGFQLITTHIGQNCGALCYCLTHAQVSYGSTMMTDNASAILENADVAEILSKSSNYVAGFFGSRRQNRHWNPAQFEDVDDALAPPSVPHVQNDRIVFVIPLQGRYSTLERFMEKYKENFLVPLKSGGRASSGVSNVQLVIVIFESLMGDDLGIYRATTALIRDYQNSYGSEFLRFHVIADSGRKFSRGAGLQFGSLVANSNDIIFFMDIDMIVTPQLAEQCRRNTKQGEQAWYPIPYSQYDPDRLCYQGGLARNADEASIFRAANPAVDAAHGRMRIRDLIKQDPLRLDVDFGFWRDFGYGIACFYKSDFLRAGGFDLSIEGWGEEDVRLYVSFLKSGIDVFRSKQSDLIHIFHSKTCDPSLEGEQARACRRTKASHYASQTCLAKTFFARNVLK